MTRTACSLSVGSVSLVLTWGLLFLAGPEPAADRLWGAAPDDKPTAEAKMPNRHALLIGVSHYIHVPDADLPGAANDVRLVRKILLDWFQFPEKNIVVLSEEGPENLLPSRANIETAFAELAAKARPGDQVVIWLSGHGSQQPALRDDPQFPEPDGLDEIFLPRDIRGWDRKQASVRNAITDNEIGAWVRRLTEAGAFVWITFDCCHSGTMLRDTNAVRRELPAERLVPVEELQKAKKVPAGHQIVAPLQLEQTPQVVAIYACLPNQCTTEDDFEDLFDKEQKRRYGLLTYTICQVLARTKQPLSYEDLVQSVRVEYLRQKRMLSVPLVEGEDRNRKVLGFETLPERPPLVLHRDATGKWMVSAGALHGLTQGSILAIYPPADQAGAHQSIGHVVVKAVGVTAAEVQPCKFGAVAMPRDIPEGARAEVVYADHGPLRLRVAAVVGEPLPGQPQPDAENAEQARARLETVLRDLAAENGSLVQVVPSPQADWLAKVRGNEVFLSPAQGVAWLNDKPTTVEYGPFPLAQAATELANLLRRVARAQNLLTLCATTEKPRGLVVQGIHVEVELTRVTNEKFLRVQRVSPDKEGLKIHDGEPYAFRIQNLSSEPVDVTLLLVDSNYGITPIFPNPGEVLDNRLAPGKTILLPRGKLATAKLDLQRLVVIAVKAESHQKPIDFSALAQPSLRRFRDLSAGFDTPLGQLFQEALYASGIAQRDLEKEIGTYQLQMLTWFTAPGSREPAK
ncbi:MAG: caspase domain-containing protein [Gemmataceae bacterium]